LTAAGGLSAGSLGVAALGGGGLIAGGLGLGLGAGIYQGIRPEGSASLQEFATVGAYAMGGLDIRPEDNVSFGLTYLGRRAGEWWNGKDVQWWNQEAAEKAGTAVGKYTGAVTEPIPVWVTKIENEVAK
jgi:hypothetical protein